MKARPQSRKLRGEVLNSARKTSHEQAENYFKKGKTFQADGKYK
jgi:tetratricopeptide (TPR) repeat protein